MRRKVLLVEHESSMRNLIYVLLGALKCDSDVAFSGQQALAKIQRGDFDVVLLDLRSPDILPPEILAGIREIRPNLMGRTLCITGEVSDPETLATIERSCLPCVRSGNLFQELWERLRLLFRPAESTSG
ncbi:MAG: response regulator [Terriglobia bacterium]